MEDAKYLTPATTEEAISLLTRYGKKARVIAGGTDMVSQMKRRTVLPGYIINIGGIRSLNYIDYKASSGLKIGALTPIEDIEKSDIIKSKFNILADAAGNLGEATIRKFATLGGNLCNAAPSADTAPALLVLGARVKIIGAEGERTLALEDFFLGPGKTALNPGELLAEIQVPNPPPHSAAVYLKLKRRQGADLALVGVAARAVMDGKVLKDIKIALGAVAPIPLRAKLAEAMLMQGKKIDEAILEQVGQCAMGECKPISDVRSSADHRRKVVAVYVSRAVKQAMEEAGRSN